VKNVMDRPGGIDGLKNQSGKCEGPGRGARRVKEPEWEMRRTGWGGRQGKEPEWECEGPGRGGDQRLFEKKSFKKKPKTSTKHC